MLNSPINTNSVGKIPKDLEPLFWSYNTESLDIGRDRRVITTQTINYGTWAQWRWLARTYGKNAVRDTLAETSPTAIRPGALTLASLVFKIQ
ncbi:MAG: hypothetical protein UY04_C0020G0006 [Parcubacteria group bacterium GW2011_GWA2_47_7]|nr:MAG: hypothetical protein UY04_C0020G0006 [Parcubacteria group bacterium GW2011_GWA2_47_7]